MTERPYNYPRLRALHNLVDELVQIIQFPKGPNAEYGDREIIRVIAYAATENQDIENAALRLRAMGLHSPSPDVVHHRLGELSETEVVELFQRITEAQLSRRKVKRLLKKGVNIAIDLHERPTWSKAKSTFICPTGLHEGTKTAYRMVTLEVVVPGVRLTLAYLPLTALANRPKIILELLMKVSRHATINKVLMDRGFFGARLLDDLTLSGFIWLMPVPRSESIKKHLSAIKGYSWWAGDWTINESGGKLSTTFTLVIMDMPRKERQRTEEKRLLLGTNQPVEEKDLLPLAEDYDGRWGIETGYRIQENDFEIHTKTRLPSSRLFLWLFQFAMYELWRLTNILRESRNKTEVPIALDTGQFVLKLETVLGIIEPIRIRT